MARRIFAIAQMALAALLGSTVLLAQSTGVAPNPVPSIEFPVIMQQKIEAGKTPVGTKVEAKLAVATNVNTVVVPRNAVLAGEVIESVAKTKTDPARLAIRIDSATWKNGSTPLHAYLSSWYYPVAEMTPQQLNYEPPDATNSNRNWNGMGPYPVPGNPISQEKFPGTDTNKDTNTPSTPASSISKHRVSLKGIELIRNSDDSITLTSMHSNIKLDKTTTYVVASGDILPVKK